MQDNNATMEIKSVAKIVELHLDTFAQQIKIKNLSVIRLNVEMVSYKQMSNVIMVINLAVIFAWWIQITHALMILENYLPVMR